MMVRRMDVTYDQLPYGIGVSTTTEHVLHSVQGDIRVLPYVGD